MAEVTIRRATVADVVVLAQLGRDTFVDTFAHLYPPEDLEAFLEQAYTPWAFGQFLQRPDQAMWVAEEDGRPVGYAHAGPCALPHPQVTQGCGELKRLYVRKGRQNDGLGARLMQTALDWMDEPGRRLWLGVWSQNHGAQRFYNRHGFFKAGEYVFPVGQTRDLEFIFRRG